MEEAWPRPGPLAAEAFDARCDMTMRPYRLGEMMKDKMDAVIGSDDAAAVRRVVHEARTRFGGHTDVQAHLTSLRIYEAELSKQRGDAGRPQLGKPPAGASPRPRRSRSVERLPSEDREVEAEDPQAAAASATPLRRRGSLPQKAFVMPVSSGTGKVHIAVIGAGYVGARIATELLVCGATVSVFDIAGVAHVEEVVWATLDDALRAGYIEARDQPAIFARLSAVRTIGEAVSEARLVCECVADNLQVKGKVYPEIVANCRSDTIFGSSTLSLPLEEIQQLLPEPWRRRLIGLRFLAPIVGISLVEVTFMQQDSEAEMRVPGGSSRAEVKEVCEFMISIGKTVTLGRNAAAPAAARSFIGQGFESLTEMLDHGVSLEDLAQFQLRPNAKAMMLAQILGGGKTPVGPQLEAKPRLGLGPEPEPEPEPVAGASNREDIALPHAPMASGGSSRPIAFTVRGFLSQDECKALIQKSEVRGYSPAAIDPSGNGSQVVKTDIRNCGRCIWDSAEQAAELSARLAPYLPQRLNGYGLKGLNERLRFLRYDPGHHFAPHYDGHYTRPDGSEQSQLTVMLYLNEGGGADYTGGDTNFLPADVRRRAAEAVVFTPSCGDLLVFTHRLLHEGARVAAGRKYAIRTDVMYEH